VDVSVVLTWCFPDEHSPEATRILDLIRSPGGGATVPAFFHQEVLNALLMGERRNRITTKATQEFMTDLLTISIEPVVPDISRIPATEALSRRHRLTAYDATYLEIAARLALPLASFDDELIRARDAEGVAAA
jgi:predicted nucleic acid-binding protein